MATHRGPALEVDAEGGVGGGLMPRASAGGRGDGVGDSGTGKKHVELVARESFIVAGPSSPPLPSPEGGGTAGSAGTSSSPASLSAIATLIGMNIFSSVGIVSCNKVLTVSFGFHFVMLLTSLHFIATWAFLHATSSSRVALFSRATAPFAVVLRIAVAGLVSILLMNYSLRANSLGSYQIMKVAVLPITLGLSYLQHIATPSWKEVAAAGLVAVGTSICTVTDISITMAGGLIGLAAAISTAQYQIYQGSIQKQHRMSSTQALHLVSLPQATLCLVASVLWETSWMGVVAGPQYVTIRGPGNVPRVRVPRVEGVTVPHVTTVIDDIWHHPYTSSEVLLIGVTCAFAIMLNYSTIALIGKTSAVAMQFVNQSKTVLIVVIGLLLFPAGVTQGRVMWLALGLSVAFMGVGWYTKLQAVMPKGK